MDGRQSGDKGSRQHPGSSSEDENNRARASAEGGQQVYLVALAADIDEDALQLVLVGQVEDDGEDGQDADHDQNQRPLEGVGSAGGGLKGDYDQHYQAHQKGIEDAGGKHGQPFFHR
jgi:hypothetical protein